MQLFFNVDVILKTKFDLLLALQYFLVLILEDNGAKVVEFGHQRDKFLLTDQRNRFKEVGKDGVIAVDEF